VVIQGLDGMGSAGDRGREEVNEEEGGMIFTLRHESF